MSKFIHLTIENPVKHLFYCSACKHYHFFTEPKWEWNKNENKPTVKGSILVYGYDEIGKKNFRCHLFITEGRISYCSDSSHKFAGQTVEMKDEE